MRSRNSPITEMQASASKMGVIARMRKQRTLQHSQMHAQQIVETLRAISQDNWGKICPTM